MDPERWRQIEHLYHAALELDPGERGVFLSDSCGDDPELRRELESLLAQGDTSSGPVSRAVLHDAARYVENSTTELGVGELLGPYRIESLLGAGGMGLVYKAHDIRLGRPVAIKISSAQFSERFEHEARATSALNHPHICTLYDVGPNYLVMELVDGAQLKGPLPLRQAIEYACQILDALDAAHRKGIIHRDLKPANILVTKQGIKLLDFGLAKQKKPQKVTDTTAPETLTVQGQILGTVQYMAPEALQGKEADARSDLFSFGCVLYEMLTGKRAFEGRNAPSVMGAILHGEPAAIEAGPPIERVLKRCLAKDPDERFQNARDLKTALTWAAGEQPAATVASKPGRGWWIAAAALTLVAVAFAGWMARRFDRPTADERVLRLYIDPPEGGRFTFGQNAGGIAISPDGKTAAYVVVTNGKAALWVRPLEGATARMLAGTDSAEHPFWSPDSKSIAYFAGRKLWRVDPAGGVPLVICDAPGFDRGGSWSSDGRILLGTVWRGLLQAPASGGTPTPLTTPDAARGEAAHRWPQALPGGRFLYWAQNHIEGQSAVYAASFAKPAERVRLTPSEGQALSAGGYLLWLRGDTLVAQDFDEATLKISGEPHPVAGPVSRAGINGQINVTAATGMLLYFAGRTLSQLTWLDRAGKPLGVLGEPREYLMFRLSPDGRHVAASIISDTARSTDLWLLDAGRAALSRLTFNPGSKLYPVWSPDGRTIVFASGNPWNLVRTEATGAGVEQRLTQSSNVQHPTDWSRDGRFVLYYEVAPDTQRDLWILPVTREGVPAGAPRIYLRTPFNELLGCFSPEVSPRWVAYMSDESGRYEIYVQAFPEPRGKWQISTGGGRFPAWGARGEEIFYLTPDSKLMAVSLKLGADSIETSAPHELFALTAGELSLFPYDVASDGQRFLVAAAPSQPAEPLSVIVNWPTLVKKGVPAP